MKRSADVGWVDAYLMEPGDSWPMRAGRMHNGDEDIAAPAAAPCQSKGQRRRTSDLKT